MAHLDVTNAEELGALVEAHDIVISYVPYFLHDHVYTACLKFSKNLVHASYNKTFMKFDAAAKAKELIFLGEMGVDPGIDHITFLQFIDGLR